MNRITYHNAIVGDMVEFTVACNLIWPSYSSSPIFDVNKRAKLIAKLKIPDHKEIHAYLTSDCQLANDFLPSNTYNSIKDQIVKADIQKYIARIPACWDCRLLTITNTKCQTCSQPAIHSPVENYVCDFCKVLSEI